MKSRKLNETITSVALWLGMREGWADFRPPNLSFPLPGRHRWRIQSARVCQLFTKREALRGTGSISRSTG